MRSLLPLTALAALHLTCAHAPPAAVPPGASPDALTGTVYWHRPGLGDRCLPWTFVEQGEGAVHLERREIEEHAQWSREVRTFYSIAREGGATVIYAPGYDYRWIRAPGPDATVFPGQRGALGYVSHFCVLGDDGRSIAWAEAPCGATAGAAVQRWYRAEEDCRKALGRTERD